MKKLVILFFLGWFFAETLQAQLGGTIGSISWTFAGSELTLTGTGINGEGVIPDNFLGYYSFDMINKDDVESVVIVEGITGIGLFAFASNFITSISIPASVTTIDAHTFRMCDGLTSISVNSANPVFYSDNGTLINKTNKTLVAYPAGKQGGYIIPDEVEIIGDCAFWMCHHLTSVFIPQSVISIGEYAFSETGLTSVTIDGTTLTAIGKGAFQNCFNLSSVSMNNVSVKHISDYAFSECHSLVSFNIPASVETIGEAAFEYCIGLTSVTIPALVKQIGDYAFWGCGQLPSISIPASVTQIGNGAFVECAGLISISVAEGNTKYSSADGILFDKTKTTLITFPAGKSGEYLIPESVRIIENTAFYNCKKLISITTIPNSVTTINAHAFSGCSTLSSVMLPASVTFIGNMAFADCNQLTRVINLNSQPLSIPSDLFLNIDYSNCELVVPSGSVEYYTADPVWSNFTQIVEMNIQITLDSEEIFLLPDGKKVITAAVTGELTSPDVVEWKSSDPTVATVDHTGTVTAVLAGTTVITAFIGTVEASCLVTVHPVSGTIGLLMWEIVNNVLIISGNGEMPDFSITELPPWYDLKDFITHVVIGEGVTHIGADSFIDLYIASASISATVATIGSNAFANCQNMTSISVNTNNMDFVDVAGVLFNKGITALVVYPAGKSGEYIIPESVKIIGISAFYNCKKLTSVTIPASVTSIGNSAFAYCDNLSVVVNLNLEPITISGETFDGIDLSACTLRVPVVAPYETSAGWKEFGNIESFEVKVSLDMTEICLLAGASATLNANVTCDIVSPVIVWESNMPTIATVDNYGKVTALGSGSAVITASVFESVANCSVTVIQPGKSTIEGTVSNSGNGTVKVNLYVNTAEPGKTKRGIIGGYVLLATTVPNGNGEYSFENLPEGSYQVEVVVEDDSEATDELLLSDDEILGDIDFIVEEDRIYYVADISTSTKEMTDISDSLIIYPNPFTDVIRIAGMPADMLRATYLQIINTAGAVVHAQKITSPDETVYLGRLSAGVYIIRLEIGGIAKTVKAVKK